MSQLKITPNELIGLSVQESISILENNNIPYQYKARDRRNSRVEWDEVPGRWTLEINDQAKVVRVRISEAKHGND